MNSPRYRWVILFLCSYVTVCYAFVFQSIPPILPNLISDLAISYTQAGALMGSFALPAIVVALPFGYLMDRFGIQKVGVTTLAIFALGTGVVAWSETYSSVLVGRIICGIGAAAVLVYTPSAIADWFKDRETGLAMGLFNTAVPLGTIIALMTLGVIAELRGWGFALIVAAAASVTALVLFVALYRDDERKALTSAGNGSGALRTIIKDAGGTIWVLATIWATFGAGYMQYFTFATEFFVAQDYDAEQAGLYASGPMWIGLLAAPASGLLLDRLGRPWLFLLFGTVGLGRIAVADPVRPRLLARGNYHGWHFRLGAGDYYHDTTPQRHAVAYTGFRLRRTYRGDGDWLVRRWRWSGFPQRHNGQRYVRFFRHGGNHAVRRNADADAA